MKKVVDDLLNKQMDRKQFLRFVGGAALLLTGVTGLMKSLRRLPHGGEGYGGSLYGKSRKR